MINAKHVTTLFGLFLFTFISTNVKADQPNVLFISVDDQRFKQPKIYRIVKNDFEKSVAEVCDLGHLQLWKLLTSKNKSGAAVLRNATS